MTRYLIIMRHAEAAPADNPLQDLQRHLTRTGKSQAHSCAQELRAAGFAPDVIIHSHAHRILQTLDQMKERWPGHEPKLIADPRLYSTPQGLTEDNLLHFYSRVMDQADDTVQKLMVAGHAPSVHQLIAGLARGLPAQIATNYPSATATVFSSSAQSWYEVGPANSKLEFMVLGGEKALSANRLRLAQPAGFPSPAVT